MTDNEEWDKLIQFCVGVLATADQMKKAEKMMTLILREVNRIEPLIVCNKLKTAYILAVRLGERTKVERIRDEAKKRNFMTEFRLCEQYLALSLEEQNMG